eukprot:5103464-Amphidinium_carterae.1
MLVVLRVPWSIHIAHFLVIYRTAGFVVMNECTKEGYPQLASGTMFTIMFGRTVLIVERPDNA